MGPAVGRLVRTEMKLMTRDPLVLTFVFAFLVVTMLVIGGTAAHPGRRAPRVLQRILALTAICHNDPAASLSCVQRGGRSIKL